MGKELKMNLITAPDTLQNDNPSILLVNPSDVDKNQFNDIAKDFKADCNSFHKAILFARQMMSSLQK